MTADTTNPVKQTNITDKVINNESIKKNCLITGGGCSGVSSGCSSIGGR
jgi:hypothetical protein